MLTIARVAQLRELLDGWRTAGDRIAFVPTMGNLHGGHHSLLVRARELAPRLVASVFVNPTQFGPNEDYSRYPRTLAADAEGLEQHGCDVLFAPGVEDMYPGGTEGHAEVHVPALENILCGAFRPGHFSGVATVVAKLFGIVEPDHAVFGLKDYQQFLVVRRLVRDLSLPVEIHGAETLREPDGLAMSSRNQYLDPRERELAVAIHRTLLAMARATRADAALAETERGARATLEAEGFQVDYAAVRRAEDLLEPAERDPGPLVALIAARLGKTRLIDNVLIAKA